MIAITVLFIYHWLTGVGVFYYNQTAINASIVEVCRSQLWLFARKSVSLLIKSELNGSQSAT
jgi:malate synthase